jgi:hypothetical protein
MSTDPKCRQTKRQNNQKIERSHVNAKMDADAKNFCSVQILVQRDIFVQFKFLFKGIYDFFYNFTIF